MKPLLCALALCLMLAPAIAQTDAPPPAKVTAPLASVTLDNGFVITPIRRSASDLENMMDAKMWEFHIQPTSPAVIVTLYLELRVPGKEPKRLDGGGSFFGQKNTDFTVGIAPANSSFHVNADKWKIYCRARDLADGPGMDDIPTTSETDNPLKGVLKGLNSYSIRYGKGSNYALPQPNGDIPLMTLFGPGKNTEPGMMTPAEETPIIAELVLVLTAKTS